MKKVKLQNRGFFENSLITVSERVIFPFERPLLTVFCWVFNDKNYIKKCIGGILSQRTSFPIEIIIHDDASTDGTQELILEFESTYPQLFNNILHKTNQWSNDKSVVVPLFERPQGKYVALLHGDDYWTDPFKLQKQVMFLNDNTCFSMCFHKILYLEGDKWNGSYYKAPPNNILNTSQIILNHYIPTSSLVFSKEKLSISKKIYTKLHLNDIYLEILLSVNGLTYYFDEEMGVYRKNIMSISHNSEYLSNGRNQLILIYSDLIRLVPLKNKKYVFYKLIYNYLGKCLDFIRRMFYVHQNKILHKIENQVF